MKVYDDSDFEAAARDLRGSAVCLGNFDGVHLGHQALLAAAGELGRAAVVTFWPHPGKVLQPALAPRLIATAARKLELLEAAGAGAVLVLPFTPQLAATSADGFEQLLFGRLGVAAAVVGADFTYGARRSGNVASLGAAAVRAGASVRVVGAVTVGGVVVSSSKVREYVLEGRVDAAGALLGRPFDLDGVVVTGAQRGRTLGFPTANVDSPNELTPATGVYVVRARLASGRWVGGVANIGVKPTFGLNEATLEVHLLDFAGDLYGQVVRVAFVGRLRAEQRFASREALVAQIGADVQAARAVLGG